MANRRYSMLQCLIRSTLTFSTLSCVCAAGMVLVSPATCVAAACWVATSEKNHSDTPWWKHLGLRAETLAAAGVSPDDFAQACGLVASGTIGEELHGYETAFENHKTSLTILAGCRATIRDSEDPAAARAELQNAAQNASTARIEFRDATAGLTQAVLRLFPLETRAKLERAIQNQSTDLPPELSILDLSDAELTPLVSALRAEAAANAGAQDVNSEQASLLTQYRGSSEVTDAIVYIANYAAGLRTAMDFRD